MEYTVKPSVEKVRARGREEEKGLKEITLSRLV